jgi:monothiol glutaredoxin
MMTLKEQIVQEIESTPIILYMKGTKERPMCGFSARVVSILNSHSVVYQDVNVLENTEIRVRLSEHSNWPTIPQLFVKGELIGGCDIVMEMENKGELANVLGTAGT